MTKTDFHHEIDHKEYHFMAWFMKNFRPDPKKSGWYIDKVIRGASATIEGAKQQHEIIYNLMIENGDLKNSNHERN